MKTLTLVLVLIISLPTFAKSINCDLYKGVEKTDQKIVLNLKEIFPCGYGRVKIDNEDGSYFTSVATICSPQLDDSLVSGRRLVVKIGSGGEWDSFSEIKVTSDLDTVVHSIVSGISAHCKGSL